MKIYSTIPGMRPALVILSIVLSLAACQQSADNTVVAATEKQAKDSAVQSGYAPVNGLKMYYEVHGEGEPLVMIHGSFMNIPMWGKYVSEFAKNRKVIVAEMQGHGRTADIDRKFTYENMADDVSALLKHLKIDSADIFGYSMGAGVTFQMGIRHPEQVRKMVILSGTYTHDGWWPDVEASFHKVNADMFKGSPIEKQYDSLAPEPKDFAKFVKKTISPDLEPYDWTAQVKKIKAPIFMIIGDADGVRYEHALALIRMKGGGKMGDLTGVPASRLAILPGSTHWGMTERVEWIKPMVNEFLEGGPKMPAPPEQ